MEKRDPDKDQEFKRIERLAIVAGLAGVFMLVSFGLLGREFRDSEPANGAEPPAARPLASTGPHTKLIIRSP